MLVKFQAKSARVKGISFHYKRPWVLTSLHIGVIQLWDYCAGTLIETFEEHDGPVRGICFHHRQPLFVSGGDDYKVKVWNYTMHKCLFTLLGHLDYVRSTTFHLTYPWILSASDDLTIRIWNWQSRACICILTGHQHYVMCSQFHPTEDLIVSASLDQSVMVWDISGLRKKNANPRIDELEENIKNSSSTELFSQSDGIVKYVLEGHEKGVNWATFHPKLPLILSGGDDRYIKLWRINESKGWEVCTYRGHHHNVSCAVFHPSQDMILSNSEDNSIRVWDMTKRTCLQSFKRENDRYWILVSHPKQNLFAAGHDAGFLIFKLERERPAFAVHYNELYYVKHRYLHKLEFVNSKDKVIFTFKGNDHNPVYSMSYNPAESGFLFSYRQACSERNCYDLYLIDKDCSELQSPEGKRSSGSTAIWIARNRFCIFDRSQYLEIKNLNNEVTRKIQIPNCDEIFYAGTGMILLRGDIGLKLFDLQKRKSVAEVKYPRCSYVVWSSNMTSVALLSKYNVTLCNRKLEVMCNVHESTKVKSGVWESKDLFIYSSRNHIKYILTNGDCGIIRALECPLYLTKVIGNKIFCLNRECKPVILNVDPTEYKFKLAVVNHRYEEIVLAIKNTRLVGQAIIAYLQHKGYPEIALHFVKDEKVRFELAIESCNIELALEAAKIINEKSCWIRLAKAALWQGNHVVTEVCYQRTKSLEKLVFLYVITGNFSNLRKLMKIAEISKDFSSLVLGTLYTGNVRERVRTFQTCNQNKYALITGIVHGLYREVQALGAPEDVENNLRQTSRDAILLKPPCPIIRIEQPWPLLTVSRNYFDYNISLYNLPSSSISSDGDQFNEATEYWSIEDIDEKLHSLSQANECWSIQVDRDLGLELSPHTMEASGDAPLLGIIPGTPVTHEWITGSDLCIDHILAGSFETAFRLLHNQVGVVEFHQYKEIFLSCYGCSRIFLPCMPLFRPLCGYPIKYWKNNNFKCKRPATSISLDALLLQLQKAYRLASAGKFSEAISNFRCIILKIPLLSIETKQDDLAAVKLLYTCRDYIVCLNIEIKRKEISQENLCDPKRICELAAYCTHCKLQPVHQILTLRNAMHIHFKLKNFNTAGGFARRLLNLAPGSDISQQTRNIMQICDKNQLNEHSLNYNELNPFDICAQTYTPIYRGHPIVKCPLCSGCYLPQYTGSVCGICCVAEIGKSTTGLHISSLKLRT